MGELNNINVVRGVFEKGGLCRDPVCNYLTRLRYSLGDIVNGLGVPPW